MIKLFDTYIKKHNSLVRIPEIQNNECIDIIVVIPVYLEDKLHQTLLSLEKANSHKLNIAVYLVINAPEDAPVEILKQQEQCYCDLMSYASKETGLHITPIKAFELPKKHFGAGLARKIGMDAAIRYFNKINNENGLIVSLDADSTVDKNYFTSIKTYFKDEKKVGCSIYFEHPLNGQYFEESVFAAVSQYELHLRYYVEALRYIGFPYAFHTIGSCFAIRSSAYVKVGGMNRRQGGEEFYFIQKIVQLGQYGNLNTTTVYPSPRISTRVPFGTGPSVKKIVEDGGGYQTYNLQAFIDLRSLFDNVNKCFKIDKSAYEELLNELPGGLRSFLFKSDFYTGLDNLNRNCANINAFKKRFYQLFNSFQLVKYINYMHEHFITKIPIDDAALSLLELEDCDTSELFMTDEILKFYRNKQKSEE